MSLLRADARRIPLADESVQCVVTSPPYWGLRDYKVAGQIGLEVSPADFVANLVGVFREVRRVLRPDGVLWLNLGDCYISDGSEGRGKIGASTLEGGQGSQEATRTASLASFRRDRAAVGNVKHRGAGPRVGSGSSFLDDRGPRQDVEHKAASGLKPKDLAMIPARVAIALQDDGWYLRQVVIWHKPNCMPESVEDRCTTAHEYIYLLAKSERYFYDADAIKEPVSGGAHARASGNKARKYGDAVGRNGSHLGHGIPWRPAGVTPKSNGMDRSHGVKANASFHEATASFHEATVDLVPERNARTVWTISTQPYSEAHFATFPEALARRCILAGTSEAGCCAACGAPRVRRTEKIRESGTPDLRIGKQAADGAADGQSRLLARVKAGRAAGHDHDNPIGGRRTVGWEDSCDCGATARPCVVLDPFAGSGTTAKVALEHGRRAVGLDLSRDYLNMAFRRIDAMRKDELTDLFREIANATAGTPVDMVDLVQLVKENGNKGTRASDTAEKLRDWVLREMPKAPTVLKRFLARLVLKDAPAAATPAIVPLPAPPRDGSGRDGDDAREAVEAARARPAPSP